MTDTGAGRQPIEPGALAVDYLMAARLDGAAAEPLASSLAQLEPADLASALHDDGARIAFWVNVYNATVLRHPEPAIATLMGRVRHFRRPLVTVAGERLSLDTIENGILRRSRPKLGLGYLPNPRPSAFERAHRVQRVDPRIHFALNCGAASCPPIAAYRAQDLDAQLELAARGYLGAEVIADGKKLRLPAVMLWYLGDFGGPKGIRRLLRAHSVAEQGRALRFRDWDWSPAPGRWLA